MSPNDSPGPAPAGAYDRFIAYRIAIMQAIALAWRDDAFRDRLATDPKRALKEGVGYDFPFLMDLGVDLDNAEWLPVTVADWRVARRNAVQLVLPPAPADPADRVEALAAFSAASLNLVKRA